VRRNWRQGIVNRAKHRRCQEHALLFIRGDACLTAIEAEADRRLPQALLLQLGKPSGIAVNVQIALHDCDKAVCPVARYRIALAFCQAATIAVLRALLQFKCRAPKRAIA